MDYQLDIKKFKKHLVTLGFRNLADFSVRSKIHRNTLQTFLAGKSVLSSAFTKLAKALRVDPLELMMASAPPQARTPGLEEIAPLISTLVKSDKNLGVLLLGSRAKGRATTYSDWDLGLIRYPNPLTGREYLKLKVLAGDFGEGLVRSIDLINLNQAPHWFLAALLRRPIFLDGNHEAYTYFLGILDGIQKEKAA